MGEMTDDDDDYVCLDVEDDDNNMLCLYLHLCDEEEEFLVFMRSIFTFSLCHSLRPFMSLALIKNMGSNLTACLK